MPGGSGFDLLARLEHLPQVIFTTAHSEHAVRAFEVNALDYLLKPVEPERLAAALSRIKRGDGAQALPAGAPLEQLFVRDGPRCWFIPLREVSLLSADGNYVRLLWGKLRPLLGRPLSVLEQRLDPKHFFRANRSQIINLDFIESVEVGVNGRLHVQLRERWTRSGNFAPAGAPLQRFDECVVPIQRTLDLFNTLDWRPHVRKSNNDRPCIAVCPRHHLESTAHRPLFAQRAARILCDLGRRRPIAPDSSRQQSG